MSGTRICATLAPIGALLVFASCAHRTDSSLATSARPTNAPPLPDRIAKGLAQASPPAPLQDTQARDAAAHRLAGFQDLINAAGEKILWGGFDQQKGYDPSAYTLTQFDPMVWAKLYLSTYTFPGPYEVRTEGRFTVLEIAADFRGGLDPGEYPYPFWHSPQKWQAYLDTVTVLLVFDGDRIAAAYRKAVHDPARPIAAKEWDGKWQWVDSRGNPQPRVALYTYLLSPENPHTAKLDSAYRKLEESFRSQNCTSCHAPDNTAQADKLLLLDFPNQALVARHSLAGVLRGNRMPPHDPNTGAAAGIHDEAARMELIALAEAFEREADTALAYESALRNQPSRSRP
jgi:hypothetical protein